MIELEERGRRAALAQLEALPINTLFAQSVLRGHVEGEAFGDDAQAPRAGYVAHPYGMALLWGSGELAALDAHLARSHRWLQVWPDAWTAQVERCAGVERFTRVNFRFERAAYEHRPSNEMLVATDEALFAAIAGSVVPRRFWRDAAQFVAAGGGITLIRDGEPAATAFCSFRHGDRFELGIETTPAHRGRGYARVVAGALIDRCLEEGLEPVWACRLENVASYRLARVLGFIESARIPYYRLTAAGSGTSCPPSGHLGRSGT